MIARRDFRVLLGIASFIIFHSLAVQPASAACSASVFQGEGRSCDRAISWRFDGQARAFVNDGSYIGELGPHYEYRIQDRCGEGVDCGAAHTCPVANGQPGRRYQAVAYLLNDSGARADVPPNMTTVCLYAGQTVPLATVEAAAHEEIRKRLTPPIVTSAPPGRSLVGLLTIYSTTPQPEPSIDITQPVPGEIRATPAYTWDFGDGLTGVGPGLAYQAGDLPSKLPGKYLGATYRAAGVKHVTLTVTWSVRFRLEGVLDVPLAPIVFTATQDKQVDTARAVLVR